MVKQLKQLKIIFYIIISITFVYMLTNLNTSISSLSIVLTNFFKSLFPYLFTFLIINQILIKTNLIYLFGYIFQFITYPLFKINSKNSSLLLLSLLNGFPSSVLYSYIMVKENKIDKYSTHKIAHYLFLPSFTFIFYLVHTSLSSLYFTILIISLYLPPFIYLLINRNKSKDEFIEFKEIKKELVNSFNEFNYINDLKAIFSNSITTLINILGMISFYSIITLIIPFPLIKGLFEFSIPTLSILNSNYSELFKTLFTLIILVFSSLSSISQASVYFDDLSIKISSFIKIRIELLSLSLVIFTLCVYFYL